MTEYECESCKGKYNDSPDGDIYMHECPIGTKDPRNENVYPDGKIKEKGKGRKKIGVQTL